MRSRTTIGRALPLVYGVLLLAASSVQAQELAPPVREIPLYDGVAPGSENWDWSERAVAGRNPMVQNVVRPVLQYYPADKSRAVGTAVIVAPGGGFRTLMMSYEGVDIAKRLNEIGVDAFVLKYRLMYSGPGGPAAQNTGRGAAQGQPAGRGATTPAPGGGRLGVATTGPQAGQNLREIAGADGQQAVRIVRARAAEFGVAPDRIGIIGFSAGGSVVISTLTGPEDGRPSFAAPIYPAVQSAIAAYPGAPPLFIAVAADDRTVGYQGSIDLFVAWQKAGVPAELHIFQTGAHGFLEKGGGADNFMDRFEEWLKLNRFLARPGN